MERATLVSSQSTPVLGTDVSLPTSTFTTYKSRKSRPQSRLISSVLLDRTIEALAVSNRFVSKVGDPDTLPSSMKNFGYRILDGSSNVVLSKHSTTSGRASRALEWETTARARRATAELLTRILLDDQNLEVEVVEEEEDKGVGGNGDEKVKDEGQLLLGINNRATRARFTVDEEKKDSSPMGNRVRAEMTKEAKLRSMTHKTSMSFREKR